jgi:hypothetical protein
MRQIVLVLAAKGRPLPVLFHRATLSVMRHDKGNRCGTIKPNINLVCGGHEGESFLFQALFLSKFGSFTPTEGDDSLALLGLLSFGPDTKNFSTSSHGKSLGKFT